MISFSNRCKARTVAATGGEQVVHSHTVMSARHYTLAGLRVESRLSTPVGVAGSAVLAAPEQSHGHDGEGQKPVVLLEGSAGFVFLRAQLLQEHRGPARFSLDLILQPSRAPIAELHSA